MNKTLHTKTRTPAGKNTSHIKSKIKNKTYVFNEIKNMRKKVPKAF